MSNNRLSPEVEANLRELHAMDDADIDLSDMPEITDWPNPERGRWHRLGQSEKAIQLEPDLLDWFRTHGPAGEDWRARVTQALREHVAKAEREAV